MAVPRLLSRECHLQRFDQFQGHVPVLHIGPGGKSFRCQFQQACQDPF